MGVKPRAGIYRGLSSPVRSIEPAGSGQRAGSVQKPSRSSRVTVNTYD